MDITQQGNVGSSKGVVFTVNATGFITRPPGAMGALLDRNVASALNDVFGRAHSDIRKGIKRGKREEGDTREHLRDQIDFDRAEATSGSGAAALAKVSTTSPIMVFHERNTRPHVIVARDFRHVLRFKIRGKVIFAVSVNHPGTKGHHLWQRATFAVRQRLPVALNQPIDSTFQGMAYARRFFKG